MKKIFSTIAAVAMFTAGVSAQGWDTGGLIVDPNAVTAMDMFNWSHLTDGVSTARATAMGGAMTSLGGDASAMTINPAGLGMYRQNDVTITPNLSIARSSTGDTSPFDGNGKTNFSIGNFGVVIKAYEGTGKVVAFNLGFGYSRLADLNSYTSYSRMDNGSSIAGVFARQLDNGGYSSFDLNANNHSFSWWGIDPAYWGATLGYKCGLVDDPGGYWQPDMYGRNPYVDQYVSLESRGSIGEYDLSMGMNISNIVYWGFTLGIQNLHQRRDLYYTEEYSYNAGDEPAGYMLEGFNYHQSSTASGAGVNLKLGVTVRPTESLRFGAAFHSPTWYSVDYKYAGAMVSRIRNNETGNYVTPDADAYTETWIDAERDSWNFRSPARLLVGASYTFGKHAILSVDYERAWYNTIHSGSTPVGQGAYNGFFKDYFKGSNSLRIGAEVKPASFMALRAGYGLSGSMLKDNDTVFSSPVNYKTQYVSCGLGFVLSNYFYMDLAYRYAKQNYTTYKLFYATDTVGFADEYSGDYTTEIARHNILLTLGFRF